MNQVRSRTSPKESISLQEVKRIDNDTIQAIYSLEPKNIQFSVLWSSIDTKLNCMDHKYYLEDNVICDNTSVKDRVSEAIRSGGTGTHTSDEWIHEAITNLFDQEQAI